MSVQFVLTEMYYDGFHRSFCDDDDDLDIIQESDSIFAFETPETFRLENIRSKRGTFSCIAFWLEPKVYISFGVNAYCIQTYLNGFYSFQRMLRHSFILVHCCSVIFVLKIFCSFFYNKGSL